MLFILYKTASHKHLFTLKVMKKQPISPSGKKMALFSLLVSILMLYWRRTPLRCCGGGGVQLISPLVRFSVTAFRSPGGADGISSRVCTCSYTSMNIDMKYKDTMP